MTRVPLASYALRSDGFIIYAGDTHPGAAIIGLHKQGVADFFTDFAKVKHLGVLAKRGFQIG